MYSEKYETYHDIYSKRLKKCKSKKDYKKLCKDMVFHYGVIDKIDENQWKIFSSVIGEDVYLQGIALAIKMYILESQGLSCDVISYEGDWGEHSHFEE